MIETLHMANAMAKSFASMGQEAETYVRRSATTARKLKARLDAARAG